MQCPPQSAEDATDPSTKALNWEDAKSLIADVQELFSCADEFRTVEEIIRMKKEISQALSSREHDARAIIQEMTNSIETKKKHLDDLPSHQDARRKEMAALEAEKGQVAERIQALEATVMETEGAIQEVEADTTAVDRRTEEMNEATLEQSPRIHHAISLYATISGIKWEYDDEHPNLLQGLVSIPATEEVKTFSLDCTTQTKFEIANALWDLCDPTVLCDPYDPRHAPQTMTNW